MKSCHFAVFCAVPLLGALPASACLNDRDSDALALQAERVPETVRVITGRFERNPPLYYEMRVKRVQRELTTKPQAWGLYDDIAVALDRLHRSDEAMQWMAKKTQHLPVYDANNPQVKEAWYRYYANDGTFRAHHWLKGGAKRERIEELVQARAEIQKAIEIKPDAHFGRERYQLMVMSWLLGARGEKSQQTLAEFVAKRDKWEGDKYTRTPPESHPNRDRAVEGLTGLIFLGAAWESVDVFDALSHALDHKHGAGLSYLALMREEELANKGKKSLGRDLDSDRAMALGAPRMVEYSIGVNRHNIKSLQELYPQLRVEADTWVSARAAFMNERLKQGRHPDTDAKFWEGYVSAAAPNLDIKWYSREKGGYINAGPNKGLIAGVLLVAGTLVSLVVLRWRGRG